MNYTLPTIILILTHHAWSQVTHKPGDAHVVPEGEEWQEPFYTAPRSCILDTFSPVTPNQLRCPHVFDDENKGLVTSTAQITHVEIDESSSHFTVAGKMVHKVQYLVLCSTGFFGGHSVLKKILEVPLGEGEASQYALEDKEYPFFPEPVCAWLTDNVAAKREFHYSIPKDVIKDLYTNQFIHPDFIGGKCNRSPCKTIWNNVVWVVNRDSATYPTKSTEEGRIFTRKADHTVTKAVVPGHHPWGLTKACSLTFLGEQWIRTDLGDLIQIVADSGTKKVSPFKSCPDGSVPMRGHEDDFGYLNHLIMNMKNREECLEAHNEIVTQNKVSPYLLSKFRPHHPGRGLAHYVLNGTIFRGTCVYDGVYGVSDNNSLYMDHEGTWRAWLRTPEGTGYDGMELGEKVIIPDLEKYKSSYDNGMFITTNVKLVPHPSIEITSNTTDEETQEIHPFHEPNMKLSWSLWPSLSGLSIGTLCILGLLWLCCCRGPPQVPTYSIPMHQMTRNTPI
ncbi:glycoprotein [Carpione rhabdovirus]|nr:glycoprotein [Carpione rhabdovirus]